MRANIASLVFCGAFLAPMCQSLVLVEPRPGAIPALSSQVNNAPGGSFSYNLSDPRSYERLANLLNYAVDMQQAKEASTNKLYVDHKVIRIREANQQIVAGSNFDVVFVVGERSCDRPSAPRFSAKAVGAKEKGRDGADHQAGNDTDVQRKQGQKGKGHDPIIQNGTTPQKTSGPRRAPFFSCFVKYNGQYGICYFKIYEPLGGGKLEISKLVCVKATNKEANEQ